MDVDVRVSLQGGHVWEFACDEDDPILVGLVTALPGASADSALPPDGLIQVDSRSGDRIYFTRTSLVAVSISKSRHGGTTMPPSVAAGSALPSFLLCGDFLGKEERDLLAGLFDKPDPSSGAGRPAYEVEPAQLPAPVTSALVGAVDRACRGLGVTNQHDTHLDVRFWLTSSEAHSLPARPDNASPSDLLQFMFHLPLARGGIGCARAVFAAADTDRGSSKPTSVQVEANQLLAWRTAENPRLEFDWRGGESALVVSGALRGGAADGPR